MTILNSWYDAKKSKQKLFAVLIDPDLFKTQNIENIIEQSIASKVDVFFIGGSLLVNNVLDETILKIKKSCDIPVTLFPGNSLQISYKADALLYLSLISGRNPELLIGKHVETAAFLKISPLEIIPTGYMLIDGGVPTSVSYMSNTNPIPSSKIDIGVCTALAGELLGLKTIYMDAGSGALNPVSKEMVNAVGTAIDIPLIVGGGIRTPEKAIETAKAGADIVVIGNAFEKQPTLIKKIGDAIHSI